MSRLVRTTAVAAALSAVPMLALATSAEARPPAGYGPSDPYIEALLPSHGPVEPMKNKAKIIVTDYGYRITLGQQNSHLTVSLVDGKLRFEDTGTLSWKSLPSTCLAQSASSGVSADCEVPATTSTENPTLLEVHPRLGNDYVSGSGLPAVFEMAVLADAGSDTVFTGEGNDFVNGAQDADEAHGGGGKDWIRTGLADDTFWGDAGDDYMVGADGNDTADGGAGTDRIWAETITNH